MASKQFVEHGQKRRVGDLKPHPKNSRLHSKEQIEQLAASLGEFELTRPLFIDDKDTLLAGHGMREAILLRNGADFEVAVSVAHGWSDKKKRAYVIADNKLSELSSWDVPVLQSELRELQRLEYSLTPIGFTELSAKAVMSPPAAGKGSRISSPIIQFNIVFDNEEQQQAWFAFVRRLKASYREQKTLGAQLNAYLQEQLADGQG